MNIVQKMTCLMVLMTPFYQNAETETQTIIAKKSVEIINHERIKKAKADYALRATWGPLVKYGILGASVGTTLASFFAYYWHVTASEFSPTELKKIRELIENTTTNKKTELMSSAQTMFMFIATSLAQGGALNLLNYGISNVTGNLDWYIKNQTGYFDDLAYLQQSYNFYAIFKDTIGTTIQLLLFDVEKILGYLTYCKEVSFAQKSSTVRDALAQHMHFIEEHANIVAQGFNDNQSKEYLMASTELLKTDIASATKFISTYN